MAGAYNPSLDALRSLTAGYGGSTPLIDDPVQGRYGRDTTLTNPLWARWLDTMKDQGVDQFGVESRAALTDPFAAAHARMKLKKGVPTYESHETWMGPVKDRIYGPEEKKKPVI